MEEGLYIVTFGVPGFFARGVAVLETNRFYGGDSVYYYSGEFNVKDDSFTGRGRVVVHTPGIATIFGSFEPDQRILIAGKVKDGKITGTIRPEGAPIPTFPIEL